MAQDEEQKEGEVFKSSVMTRSALKQRRAEEDSVTSQLATMQFGKADIVMDGF